MVCTSPSLTSKPTSAAAACRNFAACAWLTLCASRKCAAHARQKNASASSSPRIGATDPPVERRPLPPLLFELPIQNAIDLFPRQREEGDASVPQRRRRRCAAGPVAVRRGGAAPRSAAQFSPKSLPRWSPLCATRASLPTACAALAHAGAGARTPSKSPPSSSICNGHHGALISRLPSLTYQPRRERELRGLQSVLYRADGAMYRSPSPFISLSQLNLSQRTRPA